MEDGAVQTKCSTPESGKTVSIDEIHTQLRGKMFLRKSGW